MTINEKRGSPGCTEARYFQHWEWENCPIAWTGQEKGIETKLIVVLEAVADGELWIWNELFGLPGRFN